MSCVHGYVYICIYTYAYIDICVRDDMKRRCKIHGCVVCVALPRFVWCVFVVVFYTSAVFLGSSALHFGVFPPSSTIGPFHSCTSSNGPSESAHEQKLVKTWEDPKTNSLCTCACTTPVITMRNRHGSTFEPHIAKRNLGRRAPNPRSIQAKENLYVRVLILIRSESEQCSLLEMMQIGTTGKMRVHHNL